MERTKNWNILETENIVQYVVESGKTTKKIASATIDKLIERLSGDGDNECKKFFLRS